MLVRVVFYLTLLTVGHGFFYGRRRQEPEWDGLKVTFGFSPFSSFQHVPRTKSSAISKGWEMMGSEGCNNHPNFKGDRYWKNNDLAVILIFDPAGYIAGIQAGIPANYPNNINKYPTAGLVNKSFILDNGIYFVTAYFVNPANLCTGRTEQNYEIQGTGTGLWIQNGTNPVLNSVQMPATSSDADRTVWTRGECLYAMGQHYWYNINKDMSCDNLFPVFLLYNDDKLNGFGWAFTMDLGDDYSTRVEHPPSGSYSTFITEVPDCLYTVGRLTTLHIYLTNSPFWSNHC